MYFVICSLHILEYVSNLIPQHETILTYSSTANVSKGAGLLHIGHSQVGPCSCNWRYEVASKH